MGEDRAQSGSGRSTEADRAYARLREAIVGERLAPNERLIEVELAEELGVGRAAVRTALARLEQDGLVDRVAYRGARVRAISEAEAVEIVEARAVLEGLVARHAARRATGEDVARLRATIRDMQARLEAGDLLGLSGLNGQLHRQMLGIARHETATRHIDALQAQNARYQFRTVLVPGRAAESLAEHRAIIAAVEAGQSDEAETLMLRHLSHVVEALRQAAKGRDGAWTAPESTAILPA